MRPEGGPRPWAGPSSFATRLYGTPIAVLGTLTGHRSDLLGGPTDELHVSVATVAGALHGAVVRGPLKIANRLRPLVAANAPLEDAVAVLEELTSTGRRAS